MKLTICIFSLVSLFLTCGGTHSGPKSQPAAITATSSSSSKASVTIGDTGTKILTSSKSTSSGKAGASNKGPTSISVTSTSKAKAAVVAKPAVRPSKCANTKLKINCPLPEGNDNCQIMTDGGASDLMSFKPVTQYDTCCPVYNCTFANGPGFHVHYLVSGGVQPSKPKLIKAEKGSGRKNETCPAMHCRKPPRDQVDTVGLQCGFSDKHDSFRIQALGPFRECCKMVKCVYADGSFYTHYEIQGASFFLFETAFYSGGDELIIPTTTVAPPSSSSTTPTPSSTTSATTIMTSTSTPSPTSSSTTQLPSSTTTSNPSSTSTMAPNNGDISASVTDSPIQGLPQTPVATNAKKSTITTKIVQTPGKVSSQVSQMPLAPAADASGGTVIQKSSSYFRISPGKTITSTSQGSSKNGNSAFSESSWSGTQTMVDNGEIVKGQSYGTMQIPPGQMGPYQQPMGGPYPGQQQNMKSKGKSNNNGPSQQQQQMGQMPMQMYGPQMYGSPMMQQNMYMQQGGGNMYGGPQGMMYNG